MAFLPINVSEYKTMWVIVMFDLPVKTKADRKRYARFRTTLLRNGFGQLQLSVYARPYPSEESSIPCRNLLERELPARGHVRLLLVTDRQFAKMASFYGKKEVPIEEPLQQMLLF